MDLLAIIEKFLADIETVNVKEYPTSVLQALREALDYLQAIEEMLTDS